ncbi:MAG: hypothetical protein Q8L35_03260 [Actinomycetota bacterium]|nr:hypothetical protein [Actinomycetota bacterium]
MTKKCRRFAKVGAIIILPILMISVLSACAPSSLSKAPGSGREKIARKRLEFKGAQGKLVVDESGRSLPQAFPTDMPIFKPSRVKSTVESQGTSETTMTMTILEAKAKVADVAAFYQNSLPANGWTIDSTVSPAPSAVTLAAAKANQTGSISISEDKETKATIISINVALR